MNSFKKTFSTTKQMLSLIWKYKSGKKYILFKSITALLGAVRQLLYMVLPGLIINELVLLKVTDNLIIYIALSVLLPVFFSVVDNALSYATFCCYQQINMKLKYDFEYHLVHMDYETIENPDIQNLKDRAEDVLDGLLGIVNQLYSLIENVILIFSIASVITLLNPIITVITVGVVLFNSFLSKKQDKKDYESAKKIQYKMRKRHGIGYTLHMLEYAKDIRLFNGGRFMIDKFMTFQADVDKDARELNIYGNKFSFIKSISNSVFELMLYVYVVLQVITNGMQIGDMTIFTSSARQFKSSISHLMKSYVEISNNVYKYDEYKNFMSIPLHKYECGNKKPVVDGNSEIEFRDVWFKYPGTDRYILKNFNLKFNLNQKLCIVGVNGVGKSTFVKLLVRFYAPTKGEILLNGININEYGFDDYLQLFTAAFQDSKAFYFTIAENIAFSNDYDIDKINDVCKFCDLSTLINKLSEGYDTQVGKWIESAGIDFSGGELQKMLIARAAYHDSYIYLLDEPTAALDPMAEYDIYSTFDKMVKGKCAIFITHRLSAVQLADKVAVFDDGRVAEYGTHNELYAKGGIYTEMFDKQAQFYRDTQSEESESDTAV